MANRRITKKRKKRLEAVGNTIKISFHSMDAGEKEAELVKTIENKITENKTTEKVKVKKMKARFFVQYQGHEFEEQEILAKIKQIWKEEGNMIKDLKELDVYVKPEEGKVYYTINGSVSGHLDMF